MMNFQCERSSSCSHEYLGEQDEDGTIEVGKRADLVFLEKKPLEKISITRKIVGVMIRGKWLSKSDIKKGLEAVLDYYKSLDR